MSYQVIIIRSMPELITRILDFSGGSGEIWYRGTKYHHYSVQPSAYRYKKFVLNSKEVEDDSISTAKSNMFHIAETHALKTDLDWLCYLQHNGTPTRLLDWSFEFHVALYFAFEDYIKGKAAAGSLPCLWALKPTSFMGSISTYLTTPSKTEHTPFNIPHRHLELLSTKIFAEKKPKDATSISQLDSASSDNYLNQVYLPFVSKMVNERVKVQGGCFIRFPLLDTKPQLDAYRLEHFIATPEREEMFSDCLAKFVFINPMRMRDDLTMLNLKKNRIYPEVENIALDIKQRLFES